MPTLVAFVRAWLALHKPENEHKFALTAKSFFLQEAEGLSRAITQGGHYTRRALYGVE